MGRSISILWKVTLLPYKNDLTDSCFFGHAINCGSLAMSTHFRGGADLTPYYLFDDDITYFHNLYRDLCASNSDPNFSYESLKTHCDEYFYLPARAEHRGTGGIFFDDLSAEAPGASDFVKNVALAWIPSWFPIVEKRRDTPFTEKQKQWQLLRRGRYVEFIFFSEWQELKGIIRSRFHFLLNLI